MPKKMSLGRIGTLTLLLGASTVVALHYAAKYGWLAGRTHWVTHKPRDSPHKWYI